MSNQALVAIGGVTVAVIAWLFKWSLETVKRQVNERLDSKAREDQEFRKEQIEDAYRNMKGQQVTADCLRVILRHLTTGNHVEDLERMQRELEKYSTENQASLMQKAAKYNLR